MTDIQPPPARHEGSAQAIRTNPVDWALVAADKPILEAGEMCGAPVNYGVIRKTPASEPIGGTSPPKPSLGSPHLGISSARLKVRIRFLALKEMPPDRGRSQGGNESCIKKSARTTD